MANTKWHPAFCAAMRLELKDSRMLQFTDDFHLSEEPLKVDLLIIHKPSDVKIDHPIGEFFGGHNLLEYKSPTDHDFNEYGMFQALSYAYYYCDRYKTKDITLSLVVSKSHFNLLKWLDKQGIKYFKRHDGIYTLEGISFLKKVQVIVTEEIDSNLFMWLSALTDKLTESKVKAVVKSANAFTENNNRRLAEAVIQVLLSANEAVFDRVKGEIDMTLMEFMKPEVDKYAENKVEEERTLIAKIVASLAANKDNDTIAKELNCSLEQIVPIRTAMGK